MSFSTKIKDAREIAQKPRVVKGTEDWYGKYFTYHFSIYISYTLAKLRIPANVVTIMSGVAGFCGSACMVPHNFWLNLAGAFLWQLWYTLDCADGEVARLLNKTSMLGVYLDRLTHIIVNPTFVLAFGLHVYFVEPSTINLIATIAIYSGWHWKRQIITLTSMIRPVKAGFNKGGFATEGKKRKKVSTLFVIRHMLLPSSEEVDVTFFVSAVIIISHGVGVNFAEWSLYIYTVLLLGYISRAILQGERIIFKNENS